eukprot:6181398-Pleurochrysis_carterae.AAC.2
MRTRTGEGRNREQELHVPLSVHECLFRGRKVWGVSKKKNIYCCLCSESQAQTPSHLDQRAFVSRKQVSVKKETKVDNPRLALRAPQCLLLRRRPQPRTSFNINRADFPRSGLLQGRLHQTISISLQSHQATHAALLYQPVVPSRYNPRRYTLPQHNRSTSRSNARGNGHPKNAPTQEK